MQALLLVLILPAAGVGIVVALRTPSWFGADLSQYGRVMVLACAGLPVVALVPFLTNALAARLGYARSMGFSVAHAGITVAAAVAAGTGLGLAGFYGVYAALGAGLVAITLARLTRAMPTSRPLGLGECFALPPEVWRFAVAMLALAFATPYAALYVQSTVLRLYGSGTAGILQAAIGVSLSIRTLLGTAHSVFLTPAVNRDADPVLRMTAANEFQRTSALFFAMVLPPVLLFPDLVVRALYARAFLGASSIVALFVAAEVVGLLANTYQSLIVAAGRMRFHVMQNLAAQIVLVTGAAVALPRLGPAGAGLATLAAPTFLLATTLVFLRRGYGLSASAEARRMMIVTVGLLVVCGSVGSTYTGAAAWLLVAKAAVCVAAWAIAYALLPPGDRRQFRRALRDAFTMATGGRPRLQPAAAAAAPDER
jgi:O-antigen/teichoic acid export membrane protein